MEQSKTIDWIIHYVQEHDCQICGNHDDSPIGFTGFASIHTHGLNKHGHKEICIPFDIGFELSCMILNQTGLDIKLENKKFTPGLTDGIIRNFPVLFYEVRNNSDTLYMILPDPNGKFPDDEDCKFPYNKQIIYANIIEEDK